MTDQRKLTALFQFDERGELGAILKKALSQLFSPDVWSWVIRLFS